MNVTYIIFKQLITVHRKKYQCANIKHHLFIRQKLTT